MIPDQIAKLGLLAAALICLILLEFRSFAPKEDIISSVSPGPAPQAQSASNSILVDKSPHEIAIVLARPLFRVGRRPPSADSVRPKSTLLPRLTGIIITSIKREAILVSVQDGKSLVVEEGTTIGAYKVDSINFGEIVLDAGGLKTKLHPSFDSHVFTDSPLGRSLHDVPIEILNHRPVPVGVGGMIGFGNIVSH